MEKRNLDLTKERKSAKRWGNVRNVPPKIGNLLFGSQREASSGTASRGLPRQEDQKRKVPGRYKRVGDASFLLDWR